MEQDNHQERERKREKERMQPEMYTCLIFFTPGLNKIPSVSPFFSLLLFRSPRDLLSTFYSGRFSPLLRRPFPSCISSAADALSFHHLGFERGIVAGIAALASATYLDIYAK